MEINPKTLREFRADFQQAVKSLQEKYGVVIEPKKITYDSSSFVFKVEVLNGTNQEDIKKENFERYCELYGLEKSDYGRTFKQGSSEFKIIGIDLGRRKKCIELLDVRSGKQYVCPPNTIPFVWERQNARTPKVPRSSSTHLCKYCGKPANGDLEDLLCTSCQEKFGHRFYSEL